MQGNILSASGIWFALPDAGPSTVVVGAVSPLGLVEEEVVMLRGSLFTFIGGILFLLSSNLHAEFAVPAYAYGAALGPTPMPMQMPGQMPIAPMPAPIMAPGHAQMPINGFNPAINGGYRGAYGYGYQYRYGYRRSCGGCQRRHHHHHRCGGCNRGFGARGGCGMGFGGCRRPFGVFVGVGFGSVNVNVRAGGFNLGIHVGGGRRMF